MSGKLQRKKEENVMCEGDEESNLQVGGEGREEGEWRATQGGGSVEGKEGRREAPAKRQPIQRRGPTPKGMNACGCRASIWD